MNTNIYLQTAFAFISCDGEIVQEEIQLIKDMYKEGTFGEVDIDEELEKLVDQLNSEGKNFLKKYIVTVEQSSFSKEDALKLLQIAVKTIYADNDVQYSEVKFFRAVRTHIPVVDDEFILDNIPEIEDFWLAADVCNSSDSIEKDYFENIELPTFDLSEIKNN